MDDELNEVSRESKRDKRPSKVEKESEQVIHPILPYPQKFVRNKLHVQFGKFLKMPKELHLSIPFTDVIKKIANYSKFLKEI